MYQGGRVDSENIPVGDQPSPSYDGRLRRGAPDIIVPATEKGFPA